MLRPFRAFGTCGLWSHISLLQVITYMQRLLQNLMTALRLCTAVSLTPSPFKKTITCQRSFDSNDLNDRVLFRRWKLTRGTCIFHLIVDQSLSFILRVIYKDISPIPGALQFHNKDGNCSVGWLKWMRGEGWGCLQWISVRISFLLLLSSLTEPQFLFFPCFDPYGGWST